MFLLCLCKFDATKGVNFHNRFAPLFFALHSARFCTCTCCTWVLQKLCAKTQRQTFTVVFPFEIYMSQNVMRWGLCTKVCCNVIKCNDNEIFECFFALIFRVFMRANVWIKYGNSKMLSVIHWFVCLCLFLLCVCEFYERKVWILTIILHCYFFLSAIGSAETECKDRACYISYFSNAMWYLIDNKMHINLNVQSCFHLAIYSFW